MDSHQNTRISTPQKSSLREHLKHRQQLNLHLLNSSSEDLVMDKTLRNSMLQDVSSFKKQLVQLRRILQEVSDFEIWIFSRSNYVCVKMSMKLVILCFTVPHDVVWFGSFCKFR